MKQFTRLSLLTLTLVLLCTMIFAQTPSQPIHFECTSPISPTLKVNMDLDRDPLEALRMIITNVQPPSADNIAPIITTVLYSGNTAAVETVKIPAASVSVQFSVSASDNIGLKSFNLYVDGAFVSSGSGGTELLAANAQPFAVRWNAAVITSGVHNFRLIVYDAAKNASQERLWTMTK